MSARAATYHKSATADALWIGALRKLRSLSALSDGRIAELLSLLSAESIRTLDAEGWTIERVEVLSAADDQKPPQPWTARQVRHYRHALHLPARCKGTEAAREALALERRKRQREAGWWHLLPDPDTGEAGWLLWRRECMVLSLLRENGPMTRAQVLDALGCHHVLAHRRRSVFARLIESRMVEIEKTEDGTLLMLSDAVAPPSHWASAADEPKYG